MTGTIVNTCTILAGSVLGSVLKKGINEKYQSALYNAMGLAALGIGINSITSNMPNSQYPVLFIVSLAIGSLIGAILDIDGKFKSKAASMGKSELAKGLSTGIQSALYGDNTFLFTNATLDFVTSTVLASTYGIGMAFAAPVLFIWQGSIYLCASFLQGFLSDALMSEISVIGGFLIAASGFSILNVKDFKTLNMLPSLLVPPAFFLILGLIN